MPLDAPDPFDETRGREVQLHGASAGTLPEGPGLDGLGQRQSVGSIGERRRSVADLAGAQKGLNVEVFLPVGSGGMRAARSRQSENRRESDERGILSRLEERHVPEPQMTIQAIYADRASGQTFPDARAMVNAYLARFGERAGTQLEQLDEGGYTLVKKGSASVGINVLEDHGVLLFVAPVMRVPHTGRETFYRRLLELSFLTTSDAAFAVDGQRDEVVVRALRRLSGLDYEEFEDLLETVGKVADDWDDVLKSEFAQQ